MATYFFLFFFLAQIRKMETNRSICEAREISKVFVQDVTIPVTLIVSGKATILARVTRIASVTVIVIEMDLVKSVNVTEKIHGAVTTVNVKAILMGKEDVSVTVRDRVIVAENVTKTVIVMEMVRHRAVKRDIVIEKKEKTLKRLVTRKKKTLITNMSKKKEKLSSLFSQTWQDVSSITEILRLESNLKSRPYSAISVEGHFGPDSTPVVIDI